MTAAAQPSGPCVLVIFGATGDLTKRLLFPAVYNLRRAGLLPPAFAIVAVARADKGEEAFRDDLGASLHDSDLYTLPTASLKSNEEIIRRKNSSRTSWLKDTAGAHA